MNDAQTWTLIGGFLAITAGMASMLLRVVDSRLESVYGRFGIVDARFDAVDAKFDALESKMNLRFDTLDRDVQALTDRVFRSDRGH
ncbi:MAG: hypothetical protein ACRDWI_12085 [Jiangellaceae bacterium]